MLVKTSLNLWIFAGVLVALCVFPSGRALPGVWTIAQPPLERQQSAVPKVTNYARFVKELQGVPFFEWRVFVDEPPDILTQIAEVQYELHPSFDDPVQIRRDANTKFALERGGWGEFRMPITIRFKDGRVVNTTYRLDLRQPWPSEQP